MKRFYSRTKPLLKHKPSTEVEAELVAKEIFQDSKAESVAGKSTTKDSPLSRQAGDTTTEVAVVADVTPPFPSEATQENLTEQVVGVSRLEDSPDYSSRSKATNTKDPEVSTSTTVPRASLPYTSTDCSPHRLRSIGNRQ